MVDCDGAAQKMGGGSKERTAHHTPRSPMDAAEPGPKDLPAGQTPGPINFLDSTARHPSLLVRTKLLTSEGLLCELDPEACRRIRERVSASLSEPAEGAGDVARDSRGGFQQRSLTFSCMGLVRNRLTRSARAPWPRR